MYAVNIKVDGLEYIFALDSGLQVVELIKSTTGTIQDLTIKEGQVQTIDNTRCAWCGEDNLEEEADFNTRDLCINCVEEELERINEEGQQ